MLSRSTGRGGSATACTPGFRVSQPFSHVSFLVNSPIVVVWCLGGVCGTIERSSQRSTSYDARFAWSLELVELKRQRENENYSSSRVQKGVVVEFEPDRTRVRRSSLVVRVEWPAEGDRDDISETRSPDCDAILNLWRSPINRKEGSNGLY